MITMVGHNGKQEPQEAEEGDGGLQRPLGRGMKPDMIGYQGRRSRPGCECEKQYFCMR